MQDDSTTTSEYKSNNYAGVMQNIHKASHITFSAVIDTSFPNAKVSKNDV